MSGITTVPDTQLCVSVSCYCYFIETSKTYGCQRSLVTLCCPDEQVSQLFVNLPVVATVTAVTCSPTCLLLTQQSAWLSTKHLRLLRRHHSCSQRRVLGLGTPQHRQSLITVSASFFSDRWQVGGLSLPNYKIFKAWRHLKPQLISWISSS